MSVKLFIPLIVAHLLKFILFLCISRLFDVDAASHIFVGMSITQILIIFTKGQIPAAKTEQMQNNITIKQFNYVYRKYSLVLLSIFLLVSFVASLVYVTEIFQTYYFLVGGLLGYFLMMTNLRQLLEEVHGTSLSYYTQICTYLVLIILSLIIFGNISFIICGLISFEILSLRKYPTERAILSGQSALGYQRIDVLTTSAAAIELPLVYMITSQESTVTYALLLRLYTSVITFSGQVSRPLWKFGEWNNIKLGSRIIRLNVNVYFAISFSILILITLAVDKILYINQLNPLWSVFFAAYALIQIWNRFYKTKYLSTSKYGIISLSMQKFYISYIISLILISTVAPSIEAFLIIKIILASLILVANIRKSKECSIN